MLHQKKRDLAFGSEMLMLSKPRCWILQSELALVLYFLWSVITPLLQIVDGPRCRNCRKRYQEDCDHLACPPRAQQHLQTRCSVSERVGTKISLYRSLFDWGREARVKNCFQWHLSPLWIGAGWCTGICLWHRHTQSEMQACLTFDLSFISATDMSSSWAHITGMYFSTLLHTGLCRMEQLSTTALNRGITDCLLRQSRMEAMKTHGLGIFVCVGD